MILIGLGISIQGCDKTNLVEIPSTCTIEGRCEFIPTVQNECDCAGVDLRFLSLEDSRCPEGIDCPWEGEVTVRFLANGQDTVGFTRSGDLSNADVRVDTLGNKALRLIGLFPFPQVDQSLEPQDYFIVVHWEAL